MEQTALAAGTSPDYLAAVEDGVSAAAPAFLRHVSGVIAVALERRQASGTDDEEMSPAPFG